MDSGGNIHRLSDIETIRALARKGDPDGAPHFAMGEVVEIPDRDLARASRG